MSLKTKVKVGNITNLSDARYCAGMGVDMLGFRISEPNGQISLVKFKEITDWISGPEFIAELSESPSDQWQEIPGINLIEIPVSKISGLNSGKPRQATIVSLGFHEWQVCKDALLKHKASIKYLLVNNFSGITNNQAKIIVTEMSTIFPVLLGGEMKVELLDEYLNWPIEGLALNGSEETSPGIKDYDHLSSILEKLEVD